MTNEIITTERILTNSSGDRIRLYVNGGTLYVQKETGGIWVDVDEYTVPFGINEFRYIVDGGILKLQQLLVGGAWGGAEGVDFTTMVEYNPVGYCPELQDVLNYWISIGSTAPDNADALAYDTWMRAMVAGGYYAKAELLDIFSTHSQNTSKTNWKNPGVFNPSETNAPTWTQYEGFTGESAGSKYIKLNFIPSSDGTLIGTDNICVIIGVGNDVSESLMDVGVYDGTQSLAIISRSATNNANFNCNSATATNAANANGKKHFAVSRGVGANYDSYQNLVKTNIVRASTALVTKTLYACGRNNNGSAAASNRQLRYVFLFSYLTEAEVNAVIGLTNTLLAAHGKNLY